jgi:hypothetical protein
LIIIIIIIVLSVDVWQCFFLKTVIFLYLGLDHSVMELFPAVVGIVVLQLFVNVVLKQ